MEEALSDMIQKVNFLKGELYGNRTPIYIHERQKSTDRERVARIMKTKKMSSSVNQFRNIALKQNKSFSHDRPVKQIRIKAEKTLELLANLQETPKFEQTIEFE